MGLAGAEAEAEAQRLMQERRVVRLAQAAASLDGDNPLDVLAGTAQALLLLPLGRDGGRNAAADEAIPGGQEAGRILHLRHSCVPNVHVEAFIRGQMRSPLCARGHRVPAPTYNSDLQLLTDTFPIGSIKVMFICFIGCNLMCR